MDKDLSMPEPHTPSTTGASSGTIYTCMSCGGLYADVTMPIAGRVCTCPAERRAAAFHVPAFGDDASKLKAELAVSCINPHEDLKRALTTLKKRAEEAESKELYQRNRAEKFWRQLCSAAEALGKVAPEAAPYTEEWAKIRMQELKAAKDAVARLTEELAGARSKIVWGFFEEEVLQYGQGDAHAHEICSPLTAEDANGFVKTIVDTRAELAKTRERYDELVKSIRQLGAKIPCNTGGTFENDPPDAILDALRREAASQAALAKDTTLLRAELRKERDVSLAELRVLEARYEVLRTKYRVAFTALVKTASNPVAGMAIQECVDIGGVGKVKP